jgi:hypothetical protein
VTGFSLSRGFASPHRRNDRDTRRRILFTVMSVSSHDSDHQGGSDTLACSECGRLPHREENADDDWRAESDGVGGLFVFCPLCWRLEFGATLGRPR